MKKLLMQMGNKLTQIGEENNIRILTYNPIIWGFFLLTSRREGKTFAEAITRLYPQARTVVDVGSGGGGYVAALKARGIDSIGYEYAKIGRFLGRLQGVEIHSFDCSAESVMSTAKKHDIAFTIEVGEHIPRDFAERFVDFLCASSNTVIFSSAHPGQGGHGHINEQPKEYWSKMFFNRGYARLEDEENGLRDLLVQLGYKGWLPVNLQIFSKSIVQISE
jgi:hypothetical protein